MTRRTSKFLEAKRLSQSDEFQRTTLRFIHLQSFSRLIKPSHSPSSLIMPGRTKKAEDANMEDAPPSAQPDANQDAEMDEMEEEEEEEEQEPQRVKIVRGQTTT